MKERQLAMVKWFIICLNALALVSTLVIILVPGSLIDIGVDIELSLALQIYQIVSAIIVCILLAITGIRLLRQIRQYFTQIPRYLIISKYIIIANVAIVIATASLQITIKEMQRPEVM